MHTPDASEFLDVLIVGAGLSGVGAAHHFQDKNPGLRYAILEGRSDLGGTWDLFRYPGIRSDSDMYTLGYSFRPWKDARAIADGPSILAYIRETARELNIEPKIRFRHRVTSAAWSSEAKCWTVSALQDGQTKTLRCRFLVLASGYYDYDNGYTPSFPGRERYRGKFIHPQHWDESYDYSDQNVVVIGSGATAVTLVPEMAKKARHVIMLQRSPSYVASLPSVDHLSEKLKRWLPALLAHRLARWKGILIAMAFFRFCRRFPGPARHFLLGQVRKRLGDEQMRHFEPTYTPWDQRLCLVPDGDLFRALKQGKAEVVTDTIETFTETGVRLKSGRELTADLVVSATGLNLKFLGGVRFTVDGRELNPAQALPYKGAMLSGFPNFGMTFGYTNASWTLKCDLIGEWLGRLLRYMKDQHLEVVMPEAQPPVGREPLIDFSSGYFQRAKDVLPNHGVRSPWRMHQNYFRDLHSFRWRPLADEGLRFS